MAVLALLTIITAIVVPKDFPTVPYLSVISISSLKASSDSMRFGELPEWDPYLGGGRPLAPTPYYMFYAFGRVSLLLLILGLSMLILVSKGVSKLLRTLVALGSTTVGLVIPSPLLPLVAVYILGVISNCPLRRAIGSVGIPDIAFCIEVSRKNPSLAVLMVSSACLADIILALLGTESRAAPSLITALFITKATLLSTLITFGVSLVIKNIGSTYNWKRVGISSIVLSIVQICLYAIPTASITPLVIISTLGIKYIDRWLLFKFENVRSLRLIVSVIMAILFIFTLSEVSHPKFTVSKEISIGSGMKYIISPDPWFTECVKTISAGEPVWNAPIPFEHHLAPASLLGCRLGDPRALSPPFPTSPILIQPSVKLVLVSSPPRWAELSAESLELVKTLRPHSSVREPHLTTPRSIRGHGPVGQIYDRWWFRATSKRGLLVVDGKATYNRPSAPISTILAFLSIVMAVIEVSRRRSESA